MKHIQHLILFSFLLFCTFGVQANECISFLADRSTHLPAPFGDQAPSHTYRYGKDHILEAMIHSELLYSSFFYQNLPENVTPTYIESITKDEVESLAVEVYQSMDVALHSRNNHSLSILKDSKKTTDVFSSIEENQAVDKIIESLLYIAVTEKFEDFDQIKQNLKAVPHPKRLDLATHQTLAASQIYDFILGPSKAARTEDQSIKTFISLKRAISAKHRTFFFKYFTSW